MAIQNIKQITMVTGQSQSEEIQLNEYMMCGIISGSALTATTLSFLVSVDGDTYYPLYNDSGEVSLTGMGGGVAKAVSLGAVDFFPWNFAKIRGGAAASATNQATSDCPITIISRTM
jgi:hypothetical protein